jgi:hypothetical protein
MMLRECKVPLYQIDIHDTTEIGHLNLTWESASFTDPLAPSPAHAQQEAPLSVGLLLVNTLDVLWVSAQAQQEASPSVGLVLVNK